MRIEHIAIWTRDLARLRTFYEEYFGARSSSQYTNERRRFRSCFMTFESGAKLELMHRPDIRDVERPLGEEHFGYAHLAISVGSEAKVDALTQELADDGYEILDGPRRTGDGYYESVALDPDGNRIEITV